MPNHLEISGRKIGEGHPTFIVAEMSANHHQDFAEAVRIIHAARDSGADAIKLQTYTPETITLDCNNDYFQIRDTIWKGETLYKLYQKAYTPWEWQPKLKKIAEDLGLIFFSTPFDPTAADFLADLEVPAYKVASFELVDIPLIEHLARKGKPLIMSTGLASWAEIQEAVQTARNAGGAEIALLKCTSAYPAAPQDMHLRTIPYMAERFEVPVGLSDHTLGSVVPVAAVALGATIVEKHLTLSRARAGPDSAFSMEPAEFKAMVEAIRMTEKALGARHYGGNPAEAPSRIFRRSLFVCQDIKAGETVTPDNVRSIRPGHGLLPKYFKEVLGRRAEVDIPRGTPLTWDLLTEA